MMNRTQHISLARLAIPAVLATAALLPSQAQAWWRGGVFIGLPPVVVAPPVPAYPPAYYPPPYYAPGYYAPPSAPYYGYAEPSAPAPQQTPAPELSQNDRSSGQYDAPYGSTCYAGVYTCAAPSQARVGTGCSCAGIGAPSYGVVQ